MDATDIQGDDNAASFNINGETIAIAYMPLQVPWGDIEGTAQYAYNWPKALQDLKDHTGHAIVSVMSGQNTPIEKFKILSKVLHSIWLHQALWRYTREASRFLFLRTSILVTPIF